MSKADKIKRLANAVRAYRGITDSPAAAPKKHWLVTPQPDKAQRIVELLCSLGFAIDEQEAALKQIGAFKTLAEFHTWIGTI